MNKINEWLVYYFSPRSGLHFAVGKFPNKKEAIKAAYYALACYIDECCSDEFVYSLSSLYFLEGGEDLGIDVTHYDKDGANVVDMTAHMLKILENDQ